MDVNAVPTTGMRTYLGIEIGGTKLQLVTGDGQAAIGDRFRFAVSRTRGADGIKDDIRSTLDQINIREVTAIGIGFGGPVDHATGRVITSYQVKGWSDFLIRDWLQDLTGIPTWIENDANVAALGEARYGAGKEFGHVLYVTLGSGVGAGLVADGKIYHGGGATELELGHVRLDKGGRTVESSCSGWAVDAKVRRHVESIPGSRLAALAKRYEGGEAKALAESLNQDDAGARTILAETADDLAFGLSHAVHLLNPQIIILGGGLSLIGEPLRKAVAERLPSFLMDVMRPGPVIHLSSLKEDAVPIGALALAINKTT